VNEAPRTAILLAAGSAKRLLDLTASRPKCLLDVGGSTLLEHQIRSLRRVGIDDIVVVTGYRAEMIENGYGADARFVRNPIFDTTNSLYSLHLALSEVRGGFVLANADVLFHPDLLARLVSSPHPDALLYERNPNLGDEEMKVRVVDGDVKALDKNLPPGSYDGENLGVVKFSARGAERLAIEVGKLVDDGQVNAWAPRAFHAMCGDHPIRAIATAGLPWIEIDFPADLVRAREQIWPLLERAVTKNEPLATKAAES
jgi:choline kinase